MGREIGRNTFEQHDFAQFQRNLRSETALFNAWAKNNKFCQDQREYIGLELEAWLTDENFIPAPDNQEFIRGLQDPLVVPELSKFNFEINATPSELTGYCFRELHNQLERIWQKASRVALERNLRILMIGTLPTLRDEMLAEEYMSNCERYYALNDQVMRLRQGKPIILDIEGIETLRSQHEDILLEAAATSLQIHIKPHIDQMPALYNHAVLASAAIVAVAANSPYLFGKRLWHETRIPIFEQSVALPGFALLDGGTQRRVTFGHSYLRKHVLELMIENLDAYPVLLPEVSDAPREHFHHLRLHNGNIWRWNRPVLGREEDGTTHLRLEHRTPAAGPTIPDIIANICFFTGLTYGLLLEFGAEQPLDYQTARSNFYEAAKDGLDANIHWLDGKRWNLQKLVFEQLIPLAREGLRSKGVHDQEIGYYLDNIMTKRVLSGQTGAAWQTAWCSVHGCDFQGLTQNYFERQKSQIPVHEWCV